MNWHAWCTFFVSQYEGIWLSGGDARFFRMWSVTGQRVYSDPWSEYAELFVRWRRVVYNIPDIAGRWCILVFFFYIHTLSTGDVQKIRVDGLLLTHGYSTMPVAAKLLHNTVVIYVHVTFLPIDTYIHLAAKSTDTNVSDMVDKGMPWEMRRCFRHTP